MRRSLQPRVLLGALLLASACAVAELPPLTTAGASVTISEAAPGPGWDMIAALTVRHGRGCGGYGFKGTLEGARILLRNQAAAAGASYVMITEAYPPHMAPDCRVNTYLLRGTAFRRSEGSTSGGFAGRPEGTVDPDAPCNPPCPAGRTCGPGQTCMLPL